MKEAEEERQREEERLYNEWKKTFEIVEQGEDRKSSEEKKRIHDEIVQEIENEKMVYLDELSEKYKLSHDVCSSLG